MVIKADGLAAGKGVVVAADWAEASTAIDSMLKEQAFGSAGDQVIVEECLVGEELSLFAICDGEDFVSLLAAQDHKRIYDNDEGPNTGGMGAYVNPPVYTPELQQRIEKEVIAPVWQPWSRKDVPTRGFSMPG